MREKCRIADIEGVLICVEDALSGHLKVNKEIKSIRTRS
jgi:hypothetical protein